MAGSFSRRAHRGNVDPTIGTKRVMHNNRNNTTGGRRYFIQGILSKRTKDCKKPKLKKELQKSEILRLLSAWRCNIRKWRKTATIIKFVRHDKYA